jgi:hypothetical protein
MFNMVALEEPARNWHHNLRFPSPNPEVYDLSGSLMVQQGK